MTEELERESWEFCMACLDDALEYLRVCRENLEKALNNIKEMEKGDDYG